MFTESATTVPALAAGHEDGSSHGASTRPPTRIVSCDSNHPLRTEAETFVRERFHRTHGATVQTFMPVLLVLTGGAGEIVAVTGCRPAAGQPLFLERYLERSIEAALAHHIGATVQRAGIVEVGNFASRDPRTASHFVSLLPRHLLTAGFTWATFTATSSIRRILRHLGARCADLGAADGACVRGGADEWGRYYSSDPHVMGGYLPLARRLPLLWSTSDAD